MSQFAQECERLGKARVEATAQCQTEEDWNSKWPEAKHSYPFEWGTCWKAVAEFAVSNFEAEVGFYLDVLGFAMNAFWDDHLMLITPDGEYAFTIVRAQDGKHVDPAALNLQFMLGNIEPNED